MCTHCLTSSCHPKHSVLQVYSLEESFLSVAITLAVGRKWYLDWESSFLLENGNIVWSVLWYNRELWCFCMQSYDLLASAPNLGDSEKVQLCSCRGMMFWNQCYKVLCLLPLLCKARPALTFMCWPKTSGWRNKCPHSRVTSLVSYSQLSGAMWFVLPLCLKGIYDILQSRLISYLLLPKVLQISSISKSHLDSVEFFFHSSDTSFYLK